MDGLAELLTEVSIEQARDEQSKFQLFYKPPSPEDERYQVYVKGPASLIEHGGLFMTYDRKPSWVAKSWRVSDDGMVRMPPRTAWATGLLQDIFSGRVKETPFQLFYGREMGCKYLTSMPGEAKLLRWFLNEQEAHRDANLTASFLHALPYIQDVTIPQILQLRSELRDAFQQYRNSMRLALRDFEKPLTRAQARELFRDTVEPKLLALERKTKKEKNLIARRSVFYGIFATVVVALGLLSRETYLPLVGGALAARLLDTLAEERTRSKDGPDDELYFLLRLKQLGTKK